MVMGRAPGVAPRGSLWRERRAPLRSRLTSIIQQSKYGLINLQERTHPPHFSSQMMLTSTQELIFMTVTPMHNNLQQYACSPNGCIIHPRSLHHCISHYSQGRLMETTLLESKKVSIIRFLYYPHSPLTALDCTGTLTHNLFSYPSLHVGISSYSKQE